MWILFNKEMAQEFVLILFKVHYKETFDYILFTYILFDFLVHSGMEE